MAPDRVLIDHRGVAFDHAVAAQLLAVDVVAAVLVKFGRRRPVTAGTAAHGPGEPKFAMTVCSIWIGPGHTS